jgi:uncharacterized protein (TIGR02996 family)
MRVMTDEDPFIRAILDSPGDETPRLVYADWLEERGDPRGAYLRAEQEAVRTGDTSKMLELAVGLDPVWVARVTLPPLGVCCEHVHVRERGPDIDAQDIEQFEQRCGITLSHDYRAFLLNYNGGLVGRCQWETADGELIDWALEHKFYSLVCRSTDEESGLERRNSEKLQYLAGLHPDPHVETWLSQFIDVGQSPDLIHGVLLGVAQPVFGQVWHIDYSGDFDPEWLDNIGRPDAPSFAKYLSTLPWKGYP